MPRFSFASSRSKERLEALYSTYNRRCYVHPDPLEVLYDFHDPLDVEVVGVIASSLAYGNVKQILRSVSLVLRKMGPRPSDFLLDAPSNRITGTFSDFKISSTNFSYVTRSIGQFR